MTIVSCLVIKNYFKFFALHLDNPSHLLPDFYDSALTK